MHMPEIAFSAININNHLILIQSAEIRKCHFWEYDWYHLRFIIRWPMDWARYGNRCEMHINCNWTLMGSLSGISLQLNGTLYKWLDDRGNELERERSVTLVPLTIGWKAAKQIVDQHEHVLSGILTAFNAPQIRCNHKKNTTGYESLHREQRRERYKSIERKRERRCWPVPCRWASFLPL